MTDDPALDIKIHAETIAAQLPALLIDAQRVASTVSQGVHGRRRVGQGETFWQFRRYETGDTASAIDWRQSAKSRRLYVRESEWEAAQTTWLWCDASPSMHYASTPGLPTKASRAALLLLATAYLLVHAGERFTLLGSGVSARSGRSAYDRLAESLLEQENTDKSLPAFQPLPRYAQILIFTDCLSPLEEINDTITQFATRGASGQVVQILDPAEESLPFAGRVRFQGMEAEGEHLLGRAQSARAAYRNRLADHRDTLRDITRRAGWGFLTHRTDNSPESVLLALYAALSPQTKRQ
jgi:uncharacterized protein (DUF58 family)